MHSVAVVVVAALAWASAHPLECVDWFARALTLVSVIVGVLPKASQYFRWVGPAVRFAAWLSFIVHRDAPGSVKLPGVIAIFTEAVRKYHSKESPPNA